MQMGKGSRWMINFLLGKKEERVKKKKDICFYDERVMTPTAIIPSSTPVYKRRWSFGKSAKKERVHKGRRSFDSIVPTPCIATAHSPSIALPTVETIKKVVAPVYAANRMRKTFEDAAATRIQAVFRSHLARKALCALRGLVKLQALVRGHLVRKQNSATLRRMHMLMAIQARARSQRIQMARESQPVPKSKSSGQRASSPSLTAEAEDLNLYETRGISKNRSGYMDHSCVDRVEKEIPRFYSGELKISRQDYQYNEFSFAAENSPQIRSPPSKRIPGRGSFTYERPDYSHLVSDQYSPLPNYMADTESSKAKVRSQSEPKQRPNESVRAKNKQTTSIDGLSVQQDDQTQCPFSHTKRTTHENQDPWFIKIYQTTKSKDDDCDAKITARTHCSDCSKFLVTYEPHLNLY